MNFDVLWVYVFVEAFIFVFMLIVGLVYAWRKGALELSYFFQKIIVLILEYLDN